MTGAGIGESRLEGRLLSTLAHQLRNPLAVLTGYAELLALRDDEETRRQASSNILAAAERLSGVIDDVLLLLAVESDLLALDPIPVDVVHALSVAAEEAPVTSVRAPAELVVETDAEQLARAMSKLLGEVGGANGDVAVTIERRADEAAVTFAGERSPANDDSELRLHAVRRLVEALGGRLERERDAITLALPLSK